MDLMERLFFIMLVSVAIYLGIDNLTKITILTVNTSEAMGQVRRDIAKLEEKTAQTAASVIQLQKEISAITSLSDSSRKELVALGFAEKIELSNNKIETIKKLIENSPEKALSLTLIESKIKNIETKYDVRIESLKAELDSSRTYNLAFLGFIFAFIVYIAGIHWNAKKEKRSTAN
ncbi:hypothetical protein [Pseudomonas aeruginosa]|uniref:hypothetical protein n=1 Tax=Pseudomonas aeruginosa TaxID=287 RepID=UPI001269FAD1|nr:hypothetical protein [Pseudomonas aeruginosa]HCL3482116.1 hypothetical protein [Pseudomonas aeruginosa]